MKLNTYLFFDGQCEAAFKFYAQCLNGHVEAMMKYGDMPAAPAGEHASDAQGCSGPGPQDAGRIMHVSLKIGDMLLMGSDTPSGQAESAKGFSVSANVDSAEEAERVFKALSENGTVKLPIGPTFWALRFGMLVDQFGTPWMVNCEQAP